PPPYPRPTPLNPAEYVPCQPVQPTNLSSNNSHTTIQVTSFPFTVITLGSPTSSPWTRIPPKKFIIQISSLPLRQRTLSHISRIRFPGQTHSINSGDVS